MSAAADTIDRLSPTAHPKEPAIGYQTWTDLSFLHWRVPVEMLRPLVAPELTIDTYQGEAWVGLVPFYMSRIRPWWSPPVPGVSWFCETNVRTYVHLDGKRPGVWFFSLDASNSIAVQVGRQRWNLNYHRADMRLARVGERVTYWSSRRWPGMKGAGCNAAVVAGDFIGSARGNFPAGQAEPGTLEHFLGERYLLYVKEKNGTLLCGQVHHRPYPLRDLRVESCEQTLLTASGITVAGPPEHALFSDGVKVEVFPLRPVSSRA